MEPLYFDELEREKFGIYHSPNSAAMNEKAVLICYPLMQEHIRTYKACQELAEQLSDAGFHVLRFDYTGTGDSRGDLIDCNIDIWLNDIKAAAKELRDLSGIDSISVLGIRMGATLAATSGLGKINQLLMWDPIIDGKRYLSGLKSIHRQMMDNRDHFPKERRDIVTEGMQELVGFCMTNCLYSQIGNIGTSFDSASLDTKISVISSHSNDTESLMQFSSSRQSVQLLQIDEPAGWNELEQFESMLMPFKTIKKIVGILT